MELNRRNFAKNGIWYPFTNFEVKGSFVIFCPSLIGKVFADILINKKLAILPEEIESGKL